MARARIVIVNYNGLDFVGEAVASALSQTATCDVVVADNASTDGSAEIIERHYPSVRIVRTGANLGFGRAANAAAFEPPADHEYVAFLNPDATAEPAWIERLCDWMEREGVDVASSVVSGSESPFFAGGRWRPFLGTALALSAYAGTRTDWISGCAMIVRREAFERLGGFDPSYFLYYEDADLSLRATARGMQLGIFSEALVKHPREGRAAEQLGSLRKRCLGLQSKGQLVRRFVPPIALPTALLFQCLISPGVNGASLRDYPALLHAFLSGFQDRSLRPA
jgi:N-acetylglucosaminyl-diphospho-decaprenol L-rhamnosyltransferase